MINLQSTRVFFRYFGQTMVAAAAVGLLAAAGCASAKTEILTRPQNNVVEPDMIIVQNMAVTPDEVTLDTGAAAKLTRDTSKSQDDLEIQLGHIVAQAFTDELVDDLRKAGIPTAKATDGYKPTDKTLVIKGKFMQINQGNQTVRVLIGFGFGNGDIQAMVEAYQNNKMIASGMVKTTGGHRPGILVPVAGGAAAGQIAVSAAASATSNTLGESFVSSVKCDAQRAAKDVARKLVQGYINHGWAKPEALSKIDGLF